MELNRSTSYTCSVVSKPHINMMIANLNRYVKKRMILVYNQISHPGSNMYLRLNYLIGPTNNVSDLPEQSFFSNKYLKQ